jgi:hypothetical protein
VEFKVAEPSQEREDGVDFAMIETPSFLTPLTSLYQCKVSSHFCDGLATFQDGTATELQKPSSFEIN